MINWRVIQIELGVEPDGIAGPNTWRALLRRVATIAGAQPDQGIINSLATSAMVHLPVYGITDSVPRLADFLAQTANETGGYRVFVENLNYSAEALRATWPSRFPPEKAKQYARKPELIAAVAYGDRMGNLTPEEGWTFRGRGMLQLTGRANYEAANKRLGIGLDTNPEIAAVPGISLLIAADFYKHNLVLSAIDRGDLTLARRITNGGQIGLEHVNAIRGKVLEVLT